MKKLLFWSIIVVSLVACSDNNKTIMYTTTDGKIIDVSREHPFDARIVSNTYENGEGKIVFKTIMLRRIGVGAFHFRESLTSVTIPNSVKWIEDDAFFKCSSLTSITIPNSVKSIGEYAFDDCSSLTFIEYTGTKKQWNKIGYRNRGDNNIKVIYCTDGEIRL